MKNIIISTLFCGVITFACIFYIFPSKVVTVHKESTKMPDTAPVIGLTTSLKKGVDISHHNGEIDWKKVEGDGVKFMYSKITEGDSFLDKRHKLNITQANKYGIETGVYHFYSWCVSGESQINWLSKNLNQIKTSLPVTIDLELYRNCRGKDKPSEIKELNIFLENFEQKYKYKPVLYTTIDTMGEYWAEFSFDKYPLWIRVVDRHIEDLTGPNIFGIPATRNEADLEKTIREFAAKNYQIWQATSTAKIAGIKGDVDLNWKR